MRALSLDGSHPQVIALAATGQFGMAAPGQRGLAFVTGDGAEYGRGAGASSRPLREVSTAIWTGCRA